MKVQYHIGLSVIVSSAIYIGTQSMPMAVCAFVAGVFIDGDHVLDYLREYGLRLDIKHFFTSFYTTQFRKIVLLLHGWEWVGALAVVTILLHFPAFLTGILIGITHHLIADQLTNTTNPWSYFFFYRMSKGFKTSIVIPGKGID